MENWQSIIDDTALVRMVRQIHNNPYDFDEGNIQERICAYDHYRLLTVPINSLARGWYEIDEGNVKEIKDMSPNTMPPIVLGAHYPNFGYDVIDGNHRVEAMVATGAATILAYTPLVN